MFGSVLGLFPSVIRVPGRHLEYLVTPGSVGRQFELRADSIAAAKFRSGSRRFHSIWLDILCRQRASFTLTLLMAIIHDVCAKIVSCIFVRNSSAFQFFISCSDTQ